MNKLHSGPLHVFGRTPSGGGGQCLSLGGPSLTAGPAACSAAVSAPCASTRGAVCGRPQLILLHCYLRYGRRWRLKEGRREGGGREEGGREGGREEREGGREGGREGILRGAVLRRGGGREEEGRREGGRERRRGREGGEGREGGR